MQNYRFSCVANAVSVGNLVPLRSIEVALRNRNAKGDADVDSDDAFADLYSLTIGNATDLGTLALSRVRSAELLTRLLQQATRWQHQRYAQHRATRHSANTAWFITPRRYYTRGSDYDVLEFRFHPTGGGSYDKLYALAVFNLDDRGY